MAKMKAPAEVCSYVDEEHMKLHLEISVPGVEKEQIKLRMQEDSFNLTAPREDFDYATTMALCCPVNATQAKATYKDGPNEYDASILGLNGVVFNAKRKCQTGIYVEITCAGAVEVIIGYRGL